MPVSNAFAVLASFCGGRDKNMYMTSRSKLSISMQDVLPSYNKAFILR